MIEDKLACGTIFLNVVDFLLHHVTHVETAKDAWDNLCATFERRHVGYRSQLYQKFYNLKMEENILMQVHIDEFQMIINQLVNIDHQVSDQNLAFTFLVNLPLSFHTLVVSFSTRINQLSMELKCGQFLQEELRCKQEL
jgi:hypothetical protein